MSRWTEIRDGAVLFEDDAILVLNKPAGISVMGERHETDLVRLAEEAGETLFPVHRIDKVTSGALLFAKEVRFHSDLTRQFNKRTVDKCYLAVTRSTGLPESGTIDLPLGTGRKNKVRVAGNRADIVLDENEQRWSLAPSGEAGDKQRADKPSSEKKSAEKKSAEKKSYPSLTTFTRLWADERHTLLAVRPVTGRRHQIRVHLAWIGHPIEGDPLFDKESAAREARTCLHSWRLGFDAAWAGETGGAARMTMEAPPGADFWEPLQERFPSASREAALDRARTHPAPRG